MDNGPDNKSVVSAALTEIGIAAVLIILILATLNYFNILPISNIVPALSFLPTQAQNSTPSQSQQRSVVNQPANNNTPRLLSLAVVSGDKPQKFTNSGNKPLYKYVEKSLITPKQSLRVDVELSTDNTTDASGIRFSNGKKADSKDYRSLQVVRHFKDKKGSWLLAFGNGETSKFTYLLNSVSGKEFKKFALIIGPGGKGVTIVSPGIPQKTVQLSDSFFSSGRQINASVSVAPNSELDIYSLYYQY